MIEVGDIIYREEEGVGYVIDKHDTDALVVFTSGRGMCYVPQDSLDYSVSKFTPLGTKQRHRDVFCLEYGYGWIADWDYVDDIYVYSVYFASINGTIRYDNHGVPIGGCVNEPELRLFDNPRDAFNSTKPQKLPLDKRISELENVIGVLQDKIKDLASQLAAVS